MASRALLNHMKADVEVKPETTDLLANTDEDTEDTSEHVYLTLTTKKHIVDVKRLKPGKIVVPHKLNTSTTTTILLIVADPQDAYKELVASPAFPKELGARINRVIGVKQLRADYGKSYEAQRQLKASHDIILADDRIITLLPKILGKTFYGTKAKSKSNFGEVFYSALRIWNFDYMMRSSLELS